MVYDQKIRPNRLKSLLVATAIAVVSGLILHPLPAEAQCTGNDPGAPCFTQNNDILAGQRSLLPDDDLFVNVWAQSGGNASVDQFTLDTSQLTISAQSMNTFNLTSCALEGTAWTQSVIGRVFALANDVVVSIRPNSACNQLNLFITDPQDSNNNSTLFVDNLNVNVDNTPMAIAMADFNRDGYQDIFFIDQLGAQVYTAKCTNDPFASCTGTTGNAPSDGLKQGPRLSLNNRWFASPPVTGDLNGDGIIDVAWPTYDANANIQIRFMSVCGAANVTVLGQTCSQPFQIIQTNTHISIGGGANFTSHDTPRPYIALTANNFDGQINPTTGIASDELLVALANANQTKATLTVYRFDQNLAPQAAATLSDFPHDHNLKADGNDILQLFLASGPLDGATGQIQAVFGSTIEGSSVDHHGFLSVITFDENLNMTNYDTRLNTGPNNDKKTRIFGLAVGRFDPPDDPDTGDTDFDQQVAVLVDFNNNTTHAQLFTIPTDPDEDGFPLTLAVNHEVSSTRYYNNTLVQLAALQAGDLQGRSLLLGAPEKTTVAQTQPDIILGLPPMHVDFIAPPGGGAPQILNVSVFPSTFNTAFDFAETTGTQTSRMSSTSYTYSTKETEKEKITYGVPDVDSVTVKFKAAATQTHQSTVSSTFNTYSGRSNSFESATEFDDLVAATSLRLNVYSYPVIGQFVCPADSPSCSDDQKLPLMIQYSGPDNIVYTLPTGAGSFEWYQPITEPGNIFSYPGSLSLLEAAKVEPSSPALDPLTPADVEWESQSTETVSVEWTAGGRDDVSSGSVNTNSFDTSVSVSGKASLEGGSESTGLGFDYNNSESVSTLNTSSQTFGASTGVVLNRGLGSGSADENLLYEGQTYIYGLLQPQGTIQTDLTVPTTVKTHGRIEVAHVADMLSTGFIQSGDWWQQAYTAAPDVALNHPQRWLEKTPTSQNDQEVQFNCPIGFTSALGTPISDPGACTRTNTQPNPANVNDAAFYKMKGFFILPADATTGPTATLATLGDIVTLQARVYNYSLKNIDPGTTVHVRFYAQPWDATTGQFASGNGKFGFAQAVFIGEDVLEPIPAFCGGSQGAFDSCSDENAPLNWVLAQVQWDTSTLNPLPVAETNWKFWVVVWLQNGAQLVSEIAQHGLTSIPPQNVASLAEVPVETYSNNLGFYNQVFTLELPTSSAVGAVALSEDKPHLALEAFEVPDTVLRDRLTTVRIHHRASGRPFDYVRAFLFEGDPLAGGKLLDMDIIPRVPQDAPFIVPFHYQPKACGPQRLFLQAVPSDGGLSAEAIFEVFATLDPVAQTQLLIEEVESLGLKAGMKRSLLAKLKAAARSFRRGNQTAGLNRLRAFANQLRAQGGKKVPAADATRMIAQVADLESCL